MTSDPADDDVSPDPGELGQSYDALVGDRLWEVDGEENLVTPQEGETAPEEEGERGRGGDSESEAAVSESPPLPLSPASDESPPSVEQIIEALLFVGGIPLTAGRAGEIVRGLTPEQYQESIDELNRRYRRQGRPYSIRAVGDGYALGLRSAFRAVRERMLGSPREVRLSQAAVDVAALVAYQQPISKSEIDALRGADSGSALRQLSRLGLVAVARRGDASQREVCYGTTPRFLTVFGMRSLDELPKIGDSRTGGARQHPGPENPGG